MKQNALQIALITGLVLIFLAYHGAFNEWNYGVTDVLYGGEPLDNIAIISIDDKSIQELGRWPWDRATFVPILNATDTAKVVAFDIAFFEETDDDYVLAQAMDERTVIAAEYDYTRNITMTPALAFENITTGMVNIYTDTDGISRRVPGQLTEQPSFALATLNKYVQTTAPDAYLINYVGPPGSYPYYSAVDVITGTVSPNTFDDKIVLIGATAPNLHDDYLVPTSDGQRMPGVEIHAHAIQTVLTKQYLTHQPFPSLVLIILLFASITGLIINQYRFRLAALVLFGIWVLYTVIAIFVYNTGLILNLVYPGMTIIACSLSSVAYLAATERKSRQRVQQLFGKYVSKDIVNHLLEREDAVELGGEEREITAMFADIRGFTAMSENMTPHEVIEMLNHYFGDMTDIIFKHKGTLDKFIGDCLFAVWGSPLEDKNHALNAIKACLEIQESIENKEHGDIPTIDLGIGMCSGPAVVGNMGSPQRQEFTALGDTVNTASRMAGKAEGGQIVITQSTYDLIKDKIQVKKLDPVKVKGKEKPLQIYLVKGLKH